MSQIKPVKATSLNVWSLRQVAKGRDVFPNQIPPPYKPHLRRCLQAGLITITDTGMLALTEAGKHAVLHTR